jgi:cobalt-zinc-cadmium efflux system membrane fusion protein
VDLNAYPRDYHILEVGQKVFIKDPITKKMIETTIDYISPFGREGTQTMLARATVPNPQRDLRPGLFAEGKIIIGTEVVPVAVKNAALQTWEGKDVVFVWKEHGFQAVPVQIDCRDAEHTEIVSGIKEGDIYAAENSFLLKAELGKDLAEHEH